ncbi:MAG: ATP-binding cassette domain-containing protein [Erythrobacter sp.]|jgi:ABC-type lipoprotein export system ATPase subunit|nr:ATP-binding cassette domain-containing protein [Erythrobacter sp.]
MELAVGGIGLSYGGRRVLENVTFSLASGEHALLLGPSGSGKSSLLNIICGLQTPDTGDVTLGQRPVVRNGLLCGADGVRKRHMGIVFQTLRLVSALTVRRNLLLAQHLQTGARDPGGVDRVLDRLGIAHRAKARPFELSQGEAQRAAIARALVGNPAILIADEPTSALDRDNTKGVAELLAETAHDAGASLLIATHDDRLRDYFGRTLALAEGRLAG